MQPAVYQDFRDTEVICKVITTTTLITALPGISFRKSYILRHPALPPLSNHGMTKWSLKGGRAEFVQASGLSLSRRREECARPAGAQIRFPPITINRKIGSLALVTTLILIADIYSICRIKHDLVLVSITDNGWILGDLIPPESRWFHCSVICSISAYWEAWYCLALSLHEDRKQLVWDHVLNKLQQPRINVTIGITFK